MNRNRHRPGILPCFWNMVCVGDGPRAAWWRMELKNSPSLPTLLQPTGSVLPFHIWQYQEEEYERD